MQNGEHSTGGAADTAQAAAPAHAPPDTAGGQAASGWLDRVALRNRPDAMFESALRPRLPYPFEAMRFATADAAPRAPFPTGPLSQPEPTTATAARMDQVDGHVKPPVADALRPAAIAPAATAPARQAVAVAVPQARQEGEDRPLAAAPPAHGLGPAPATNVRAQPDQAVRDPAAAPATLARPDRPAQALRLAPAESAGPQAAAARPSESPSMPAPAAQAGKAAGQATPGRPSPAPNDKPAPQADKPTAGALRKAPAERPRPALRGVPPAQAPLAARQSAEAAPEITIDIHIGRIDVRAPAAAQAGAAVQAPPQRGGEALNAYLARRARGARS